MARSWEYSARRRVLMQGLMWVLFIASLGVAGVLSNRKSVLPKITLNTEPRQLGELLVHAPVKWKVATEITEGKRVMKMTGRGESGLPRMCIVSSQPIEGRTTSAQTYLEDATGETVDDASTFNFKNLGKGVQAWVMADSADDDDSHAALCASIVIPRPNRAGESLGVLVVFFGLSPNDPTTQRWLQSIADGISVNPNVSTRPAQKSN